MIIQYLLLFLSCYYLFAQSEWTKSYLPEMQLINCFSEDSYQNIYLSTPMFLYKSEDKGLTWEILSEPPEGEFYTFIITENNTLIARSGGNIYRSVNFGQNWNIVLSEQGCKKILSRKDTCYINTGLQIYHSYDDGLTWDYSSKFNQAGYETHEMALGPNGEIYVTASFIMVSAYAAVYLSTDGGINFIERGVFNDLLPSTIIVNSAGTVFASEYISYDMGKTWHLFFNKEEIKGKFLINSQDILFQSNYSGAVFKYAEADSTWRQILAIPSNEKITASFIDSQDYFYVGTDSGIVYRSTHPTFVSAKKTIDLENFKLYQNYPNPFNSYSIIKYKVLQGADVQLTIYDLFGREIKTLVHKHQNTGEYSVLFDAGDLASGIYIYKLKVGSSEQSRKMVLLR